ncbi:MAG: hypothetical protein ABIE03_01200 [Patescibacteria group bacterium]|nr:hypothetical protein [Patescibacteria group bacterium]
MQKRYLLIGIFIILLLLLLVGGILIGIRIARNSDSDSDGTTNTQSTTTEEEKSSLEEATANYDDIDSVRAVGEIDYEYGGKNYEIATTAMTKNLHENFIKLVMEGEELLMYTEESGDKVYAYMSDGKDTVRFEVEEGSEGEDIYDEVSTSSPEAILDDMEEWEESPDFEVEYKGEESCRDMTCDKYIVTDKETGGIITVWVDTSDDLPRILEYDSDNIKGVFDIYYDGVDFKIPTEYDEIQVDTVTGLLKLKAVLGDYVKLFF